MKSSNVGVLNTPWYSTQYHYRPIWTLPPSVFSAPIVEASHHMSIHQILDRYQKNLAVPRVEVANYDVDVSAYDKMDRFERLEAARVLAARSKTLRDLLNSEGAKLKEKKDKEDFDARVDEAAKSELARLAALKAKGGE